VKCDETEKADGAWSRKGGEFSPSSTAEALRPWTIQSLDIGLSQCGLVHEEGIDCRGSIKRETFFVKGSSATHIGEVPRPRGEGITTDTKTPSPWVRSASVQLYTTAMEGVMSKILFGSLVVLLLAFFGLVGCDTMTRDQWGIRIQPVWQR